MYLGTELQSLYGIHKLELATSHWETGAPVVGQNVLLLAELWWLVPAAGSVSPQAQIWLVLVSVAAQGRALGQPALLPSWMGVK